MKRLLALSLALAMPGLAFANPTCNCGPDYCLDTPGYKNALANKKAAAQKGGAPARLVALYDKLDHCEAAIRMSPDSFNILRQSKEGDITIDGWTSENEKNDAAAVKNGALKACYVILARTAFACCNAPKPEDRPDYDSTLEMSKSTALACQ
ncbi:hypothetical protein [Massilia sp. DD77]|uniref:hypothetical protein n=1 Tax=Massilia sp. DD77 TaxID=3109349 RepID=UPI002FFDF609